MTKLELLGGFAEDQEDGRPKRNKEIKGPLERSKIDHTTPSGVYTIRTLTEILSLSDYFNGVACNILQTLCYDW